MSQPNLSRGAVGVLLAAGSLTVMSNATIAPALPAMYDVFANHPHVALLIPLVLTFPSLCIALASPLAGLIIDRLGRKPVLIAALALFALAGSSGLWAGSIEALLLGRAFLGMSVAGIMIASTTLIADYFDESKRQHLMGLQAAAMGIGGMCFMTGGGVLAEIGWRWPFAIYLSSLALVPMATIWIGEPKIESHHAHGVIEVKDLDRKLAMLVGFSFMALTGMMMFYLIPVKLPFHLKALTGGGASQVGLAIGLSTFISAMVSLQYKKLRKRYTARALFAVVYMFIGTAFFLLTLAEDYSDVILAMVVGGFGYGLFLPNLNVELTAIAPEARRGRWIGVMTACLFLGQFLSPLAVYPIVQVYGITGAFAAASGLSFTLGVGFAIFSRFNLSK